MEFLKIFKNKKILITGHTGFKGSWLAKWLSMLGGEVYGYALAPSSNPNLFDVLNLEEELHHTIADIRDYNRLRSYIATNKPDFIFHLAAQSIVLTSYQNPLETIQTNVLGTVNLLEAVRNAKIDTHVVVITSDKSYENNEWMYGYREIDRLGGYDPYSASKGAADLLTSSWIRSFFDDGDENAPKVKIATARAGNVIGGGDWADNRIVPDCVRNLNDNQTIVVRNPKAMRPWQHVIEPLSGYLKLAAELYRDKKHVTEAFNFGPMITSNKNVQKLVEEILKHWEGGSWEPLKNNEQSHEANLLNLTIDKSYHMLNWLPIWDFSDTVKETISWYKCYYNDENIAKFTEEQIQRYQELITYD